MRAFKELIACTVVVMAGILLFSELKDLLSCKEKTEQGTTAQEDYPLISPSLPSLAPPVVEPKTVAPKKEESKQTNDRKLKRFGELRKKVLLNDEESVERERLLSNVKTIDSIGTRLTDPKSSLEIKERLSMIDFLEDAAAWEDNPVREEVFGQIEDVIRSETFVGADQQVKRQLVGDKIELLTILSEQAPQKAAILLDESKGTKLEPILKYAVKRLRLKNLQTEK